jgi:hypothetical protein
MLFTECSSLLDIVISVVFLRDNLDADFASGAVLLHYGLTERRFIDNSRNFHYKL